MLQEKRNSILYPKTDLTKSAWINPWIGLSEGRAHDESLFHTLYTLLYFLPPGLDCEIDIQKTVQHVRTQRPGMVQLEVWD